MRRRSSTWLPESRYFKMPYTVGCAANFITVAFAILVLIIYDLPTRLPVSASNMSVSL